MWKIIEKRNKLGVILYIKDSKNQTVTFMTNPSAKDRENFGLIVDSVNDRLILGKI